MKSGVFCRSEGFDNRCNSMIIDRFNKIIHNTINKVVDDEMAEPLSAPLSSSSYTNSSEDEKWEIGQNVRAPFGFSSKLYEGHIVRMVDEFAVVKFYGYNNEEAIKLSELRPTLGEDSIRDQVEKVNEEVGESEESEEAVNWSVGMNCRALYLGNDTIYEAVIQKIFPGEKKAIVKMVGYGIIYHVDFKNMYKSEPALLAKQERYAYCYPYARPPALVRKIRFHPAQLQNAKRAVNMKFNEMRQLGLETFKNLSVGHPRDDPMDTNSPHMTQNNEAENDVSASLDHIFLNNVPSNEYPANPNLPSGVHDGNPSQNDSGRVENNAASNAHLHQNNMPSNLYSGNSNLPSAHSFPNNMPPNQYPANSNLPSGIHGLDSGLNNFGGMENDMGSNQNYAFQNMPPNQHPTNPNRRPGMNGFAPDQPCRLPNCQGIIQPESEPDALACISSSSFLCGYYAGYYDCLRKFQN